MALMASNNQFIGLKKKSPQATAIKGIQYSLIKVQNGVQPCRATPEQSRVAARNPTGIEASNRAFEVLEKVTTPAPLTGSSKLNAAIKSADPASRENGIARSKGISRKKSMAKRINKMDETI